MSNTFCEKLAPMIQEAVPEGVTAEAHDNWNGFIFVYHDDGWRGHFDLTPDNRRNPDHTYVSIVLERARDAARRMAGSPIYTEKARAEAQAAYEALAN